MTEAAPGGAVGPPRCPVCGPASGTSPKFSKNGYDIHRCRGCSLLFVHPQPSEDEVLAVYGAEYFRRGGKYTQEAPGEDPNRPNELLKLQVLERFKSGGRILDVGCALGGFLMVAREHGFDVVGVEVAPSAAAHVRKTLGIEVANRDLPSAGFPAESFDGITLWDVLEHLRDPRPTLSEAHRLLRPDGVLIVSTGDAHSRWARLTGRYWQQMCPPQHLFFYTRKSLIETLALHDFSVREISYPGRRGTLELILLKAEESLGPAVRPVRASVVGLGLGQLQPYVNLRDVMTCVAVKTHGKS